MRCGAAFGADFGLSAGAAAALVALAAAALGLVGWALRAQLAQLKRALKTNGKIMLGLGQVRPRASSRLSLPVCHCQSHDAFGVFRNSFP